MTRFWGEDRVLGGCPGLAEPLCKGKAATGKVWEQSAAVSKHNSLLSCPECFVCAGGGVDVFLRCKFADI